MTRPRRELVSVQDTPYYHIVSRCVRRAFLCGVDHSTQTSYEHRRQWIVDRIRLLSSVFAIDIAAYAVMSNHYHIVVKLDPSQLDALDDNEIIRRWTCLFKGPLIIQQAVQYGSVPSSHQQTVNDIANVWRARLADLSWFMKCLNEPIARRANKEDHCTGHFWEARYKSQALRTEAALLACMAYVDLNPVRANMANTPEESGFTSIKERVKPTLAGSKTVETQRKSNELELGNLDFKPLLAFTSVAGEGLPGTLEDYVQLVDWTGRCLRPDKRGSIAPSIPPILKRLALPPDDWLQRASRFEVMVRKKMVMGRLLRASK
ncbi:MAG: transposase [Pseudomonadales bacterium]